MTAPVSRLLALSVESRARSTSVEEPRPDPGNFAGGCSRGMAGPTFHSGCSRGVACRTGIAGEPLHSNHERSPNRGYRVRRRARDGHHPASRTLTRRFLQVVQGTEAVSAAEAEELLRTLEAMLAALKTPNSPERLAPRSLGRWVEVDSSILLDAKADCVRPSAGGGGLCSRCRAPPSRANRIGRQRGLLGADGLAAAPRLCRSISVWGGRGIGRAPVTF